MNFTDKKIVAKVERVVYPKPEAYVDGPCFYILRTDVGSVKGKLNHVPAIGERFNLEGKWEVSKWNGSMEFSFFHASAYLPTDERAMLKYACEMTCGLGPTLEEKIWEAKGDNWREVSEADGIRGLSPNKLCQLQSTIEMLNNHKEQTEAIAWLMSIGLTVKMAESAWDKWQKKTVTLVKEDCYILAKLQNYGFSDVDQHVRRHFGIERNDTRRVRSCLKYYLAQLTQENTICSWQMLYDKVSKAIDADPVVIGNECRALFDTGKFVAFPKTGMISSERDFAAETAILKFVRDSVPMEHVKARQPAERSFDLDEKQMAAVQFALDNSFCTINGGAGCGKTTLIKAICDSLKGDVDLCAFAGKAAARLKEATGHDAGTIHRLLKYMGDGMGFTLKTLVGRTVVLDEASMVSSDLMGEIIKRNPKRLILVGDEAQLPPVGSGQPFHDIIKLCPEKVQTLNVCYRNREAIFSAALNIRNGEIPPMDAKTDAETWRVQSIRDPREAHNEILRAVRADEIDFDSDIILCCRNGDGDGETECSVIALNRDIKDIVNPNEDGSYKVSPGDRVINTKNHAELDVWNGTTGKCDKLDSDGAMWVRLDYKNSAGEDYVLIPKKEAREWQLAYAMTVHKSQGSQYRKVYFVVSRRDQMNLLSRPMVYTAVTRAKKVCTVVGDVQAFHNSIRTVVRKLTVMQEVSR
jgi:exodeoxyribonuclease V alpha subunit